MIWRNESNYWSQMGRFNYNKKRYWYHLSDKFIDDTVVVNPWSNRARRAAGEPDGRRLCVGPTIAHCLTALPHLDMFTVYRTKEKVLAEEPDGIYDSSITKEGWITHRVELEKIGVIDLTQIESELGELPIDAAQIPRTDFSKRAFRSWKNFAEFYIKTI